MKNYVFEKNQWFFKETAPGILNTKEVGIRVKKKIFSGRSPYQKFEVIDTFPFGRILVLDGIVQLSEKDEFIYHEMLFNFKKTTLKNIEKKYKKLNPVRDYKNKEKGQRKQISNGVNLDLKYYNPKIHFASAVLPQYLKEKINVNT